MKSFEALRGAPDREGPPPLTPSFIPHQQHSQNAPVALQEELMTSIRTCKSSEDEISLEAAPICQECSLSLAEYAPTREVTLVLSDTEKAMRVYSRRLSSEACGCVHCFDYLTDKWSPAD